MPNLAKDILKEILNILSLRVEKMDHLFEFDPCIDEKNLKKIFPNINFSKKIKKFLLIQMNYMNIY